MTDEMGGFHLCLHFSGVGGAGGGPQAEEVIKESQNRLLLELVYQCMDSEETSTSIVTV